LERKEKEERGREGEIATKKRGVVVVVERTLLRGGPEGLTAVRMKGFPCILRIAVGMELPVDKQSEMIECFARISSGPRATPPTSNSNFERSSVDSIDVI
jgi:hypothetical protein